MINKILVLTDFSVSSMRALEWAGLFARKLSVPIHIFHRLDPPAGNSTGLSGDPDIRLDEYMHNTDEKLKALEDIEMLDGLDVTTSATHGDFIGQVEQLQRLNGFDFIVMGARGMRNEADKPMGSHAVKAVRKLDTHILVVPEEAEPEGAIREVLFASALNESDRPALKWLMRLIQIFNTEELHIMSVNTGSYFTQPTLLMESALTEFVKLAQDMDPGMQVRSHFYKNSSVLDGIVTFGREEHVDLIAMPNHGRHALKRIFFGSTVEALVQVSHAPVLCINLQ